MLKAEFVEKFQKAYEASSGEVNKMVVAVKLPTGAVELIINTELIGGKVCYYLSAYDDNMCLKTNPAIEIIDCMFV